MALKRRGGARSSNKTSQFLSKTLSSSLKYFCLFHWEKEPGFPTSAILKKNSRSLKQLCDYFTGRRSQESRPPTLHGFCSSGRGCGWQLDTLHCTLYTVLSSLHTVCCALHTVISTAHCIVYTTHCMIKTSHCILYTVKSIPYFTLLCSILCVYCIPSRFPRSVVWS